MADTSIEWCDKVWNPVRGCKKISPGCAHCYAETFAERWRGIKGHPYEQGFDLRLVPEKLDEPLRWRKSHRIFVNSMSDLFQDGVPFKFIDKVFAVMALSIQHTFQVLTKRPLRMLEYIQSAPKSMERGERIAEWVYGFCDEDAAEWAIPEIESMWDKPLPNVWLGVSVEDRKYGLPRVDILRKVPAALRFISIEPLLEDLGTINLDDIGWVIIGGESGHGARPLNMRWVLNIIEQCKAASVPVFLKQFGAVLHVPYYIDMEMNRDDIREWAIDQCFPGGLNRGRIIDGCTGHEWDESHQPCDGSYFDIRLPHKGGNLEDWPTELRELRQFPTLNAV